MKIKVKVEKEVEPKILKVHAKPCDAGTYTLTSKEGLEIHEHDGYVPKLLPGDHYGDYIILDIDIETGQILNWKPPTEEMLEAFCRSSDDE
jgi:hypothetical protein